MSRMSTYLYTIICCGFDIDIYSDQVTHCPHCRSSFVATRDMPEDAVQPAAIPCQREPLLFDGFTMSEALALRERLHHANTALRRARMGAAELVIELNYGAVRDVIKRNHHLYSETLREMSDLTHELAFSDLA
jgi:hypothetical protein